MGRAVAISNSLVRGSLLTAAWLCVVFWAISVMRLSREPVLTNKLAANIKCARLWLATKWGQGFFGDRGGRKHSDVLQIREITFGASRSFAGQ